METLWIWPLLFIGGLLLGLLYFRFLWWTVRRLAGSTHPVRLLMISLVIRLGFVCGTFYLLMDGEAGRLLVVLGGFVTARELCKRLWGERPTPPRIRAAIGECQ